MPEMNATLEAIAKELHGLLTPETDTSPKSVAMTPEQFIAYASEQIVLAKADNDPGPRLRALAEVVNLAKSYSWEENDTMGVSVYSGDLSVQAGSRQAEKIAEHPGMGLGVPGPQSAPVGGAFEGDAGPSGPATNTAKPAQRIMPPALPQSTPAGAAEGWMAKAATVLKSVDGGEALLGELRTMLSAEAKPGDGEQLKKESRDDGWPLDLATPAFLEDKPEVLKEDDFGIDPNGLGRGKHVND